MGFAWTIVVLVVLLAISWRFLGSYMAAVFEGRVRWLSLVERPIYRVMGVDPKSRAVLEALQRLGDHLLRLRAADHLRDLPAPGRLPFNPQHLPGVTPALSWNTAVSFVTNTNWQAYSGETTMSYLSQMGSLAVQNFLSAAVGIAVAVALIRGFAAQGAPRPSATSGSTWSAARPLHPAARSRSWPPSSSSAQGALQTLAGPVHVPTRSTACEQIIPRGPVASQEVIKQLGHERRRVLQRQRRQPVREPDRADQLPVHPADPVHPGQR